MSANTIQYRLDRLSLYETSQYLYLIGHVSVSPPESKSYRLVTFDKERDELRDIVNMDQFSWSRLEMDKFLETINLNNRESGGIKHVMDAVGIVGFPRFLDCYYISLITQSKKVGCINGKSIFQVKNVEIIPIQGKGKNRGYNTVAHLWSKINNTFNKSALEIAEARYVGLYNFLDMSKDFYFSYDYDLTKCLQFNFTSSSDGVPIPANPYFSSTFHNNKSSSNHRNDNDIDINTKTETEIPKAVFKEDFLWNCYQMKEFNNVVGESDAYSWHLPLIHGSFHQQRFDIFGKPLDLALIARRSTHYAGTRFLKRGVSVHGKVANDVEVEQILQLDGPYDGAYSSFVSFTQMRGSIPTYWSQEVSVTNPKPPIIRGSMDSERGASRAHFRDLICRYGTPIIVLDLVKQFERKPREVIVGQALKAAVAAVNKSIDPKHQIRYCGLDYTRSLKKKDKDHDDGADDTISSTVNQNSTANVTERNNGHQTKPSGIQPLVPTSSLKSVGVGATHNNSHRQSKFLDSWAALEEISLYSFVETDFFVRRNGRTSKIQSGVLRTNCVDCLDRTGVAQYIAGVVFLPIALKELGLKSIIDAQESMGILRNTLRDMYAEMGDRISLQYGGSEAHKKIYGARSALLTNIKRYYSNAFTDQVKQDAMNIFLGKFQPLKSSIPLWEMDGDFMLHNSTHVPLCSLTDLSLHSNCFNRDWLLKILGFTGIKCKPLTKCYSPTKIMNDQEQMESSHCGEDHHSIARNDDGDGDDGEDDCNTFIRNRDVDKFVAIIESTYPRKRSVGSEWMKHQSTSFSVLSQSHSDIDGKRKKSFFRNRDLLFQAGFVRGSLPNDNIDNAIDDSEIKKKEEDDKEEERGKEKDDENAIEANYLHRHKARELTTLYKAAEAQWWMTALAQFRLEVGLRDINQPQSSNSTTTSASASVMDNSKRSALTHEEQVIDSVCLTHSIYHDVYKTRKSGRYRRKTPRVDDCTLNAMHYVNFELPGYGKLGLGLASIGATGDPTLISNRSQDDVTLSIAGMHSTDSSSFSMESYMSIARNQSDVYATLSTLGNSKLLSNLNNIDIKNINPYELNAFQVAYHPCELSCFKDDMLPTSISIGNSTTLQDINGDSSSFYISNTKKVNNQSLKSFIPISSSASNSNTSIRKKNHHIQKKDEQINANSADSSSNKLPVANPVPQLTSSSLSSQNPYAGRPPLPPSHSNTHINSSLIAAAPTSASTLFHTPSATLPSAIAMISGSNPISPLSAHDPVHSYGVASPNIYSASSDGDSSGYRNRSTFNTTDSLTEKKTSYNTFMSTDVGGVTVRGNRSRTLSSPMSLDSRGSESDMNNLLNDDIFYRRSCTPIRENIRIVSSIDTWDQPCLLSDSTIPVEPATLNQHEPINDSTMHLYKDYADLDNFANSNIPANHISSLAVQSETEVSDLSTPTSLSPSDASVHCIRSLPIAPPRMVGNQMTDEEVRKYNAFQDSLAPSSIKSTDVQDLQNLAKDCGYSDYVRGGIYAGKPWNASATATTAAIFGITDSLEPELDLSHTTDSNINIHEDLSASYSKIYDNTNSQTKTKFKTDSSAKNTEVLPSSKVVTNIKGQSNSIDSTNSISYKLIVEEKALNSKAIERDRFESRVLSNENLNGLARAAVKAGANANKDGDVLHELEKAALRPPRIRAIAKRSTTNSRDLREQMRKHTNETLTLSKSNTNLRTDRVKLMCHGAVLAAALGQEEIGDVNSLESNARREIRRHLYRQLMYHRSIDNRLQQRISNLTNEKTLFQYYSNQSNKNSIVQDIETIHYIMTQELLSDSVNEDEKEIEGNKEKEGKHIPNNSNNFSKFKEILHGVAVERMKEIMWLRRPGAEVNSDGSNEGNICIENNNGGNSSENKKENKKIKITISPNSKPKMTPNVPITNTIKDNLNQGDSVLGVVEVKMINIYEDSVEMNSHKNPITWISSDDGSSDDGSSDSDGESGGESGGDSDSDESVKDKDTIKDIAITANDTSHTSGDFNNLKVEGDNKKLKNSERNGKKRSMSILATANLWELGQSPEDYPPDLGLFTPYSITVSSENPMAIEEEFLHRSATSELFSFKSNSMLIMNRIAAVMFCRYREMEKGKNQNNDTNNNTCNNVL